MLNGIGGRTIAEAKECLSAREVQLWSVYRSKNGGLNPMQRADYNAGLQSMLFANANRGKATPAFRIWDFTRFQDEAPIGLDEAMSSWG